MDLYPLLGWGSPIGTRLFLVFLGAFIYLYPSFRSIRSVRDRLCLQKRIVQHKKRHFVPLLLLLCLGSYLPTLRYERTGSLRCQN